MKYRFLIVFMLVLIPVFCFAKSDRLQIGTNLSGPADWNTEQPFANIMKFSRSWITQNNAWISGGENTWDTQLHSYFEFDENGYPLQVPIEVQGAEAPQIVLTVWAHGGALPAGDYVCLYDGEGIIDFTLEAQMVSSNPRRIVFNVPETSEIIALRILQSQPGNHVRNIRVLVAGDEASYKEEPFQKDWLEKLAPFTALRFMDWSKTNDSRQVKWQDRPQVDDYTYTPDGVPYEWMIAVCNRLQTDAWVCVPHRADDAYVREMARLFRDNLDPGLKIYVEWSNEVWNWMFPQAHYGLDSLDQNLEWPERLGPKIESVMQIWTQEFNDQENRLVRVLAMQHTWPDLVHRVYENLDSDLIDAFSPAAYVGLNASGFDSMTTAADVWASAYANFENEAMPMWRHWTEFATAENKRLVYYEGGQHFTPDPFRSDQPYNQLLQDLQTSSEMYALYTRLLDSLQALNQESLFMNFSFVGQKSGKYGSWGVLESQYMQPPFYNTAPKYQALLDFIDQGATLVENNWKMPATHQLHQNFPNPFNPQTNIRYKLKSAGLVSIRVFDLLGREIEVLINKRQSGGLHNVQFDGRNLASGIYFYSLEIDGKVMGNRKMILMK